MPELKHNFTKGRMNKDFDERLIPNGEYRDAMNIQVSTSEDSNVGTVQNILGNSEIEIDFITESAVCVGSVADEKNDKLYWFINASERDTIVEYDVKNDNITPVFVDLTGDILKFDAINLPSRVITGINIIDGMLFWTDNYSEPKKINIQRSIDGTDPLGLSHTKLINPVQGYDIGGIDLDLREEHITIIKKSPKHPPTLQYEAFRDPLKNYTGVIEISDNLGSVNSLLTSSIGYIHDFQFLEVGDYFKTIIETDINANPDFSLDWKNWMAVVIKEFNNEEPPSIPISNYTIKGKITDWQDNKFFNIVPQLITNSIFDDESGWHWELPWTHSSSRKRAEYDGSIGNGNEKLKASIDNGGLSQDIKNDATYRVEYTVKKIDPSIPLQGNIFFRIVDENGQYDVGTWRSATGTYSEDITIGPGAPVHSNSYTNVFYFESVGTPNFIGSIDDVTITQLAADSTARVEIRVDSIDGTPPHVPSGASNLKYAVDKFDTEEKLFEFKFPRFAYRYKYEDGEYSTISPFSQIAFVPGSFDYHPKKGYNLGMVNNLKSVTIRDYNRLLPEDVTGIDILYKEEHSPNIYIVDEVKDISAQWSSYKIDAETIKNGVLPSNQLLRHWDNVPRKALAQDVVGNRVVYGNYVQNYNLEKDDGLGNLTDYNISIDASLNPIPHSSRTGKNSIKSLREYQVGVVYTDKYGRETPVLTSSNEALKLSKDSSSKVNQLEVRILNEGYPINMKYFKFYVKDTGGEYYNLAMDRFYNAEDDNIWLAFPSTDRNKVNIDDFLILKKGVGRVTNDKDLIKERAKYKIIDIQNEAPDFIKRKETLIASKSHRNNLADMFFTDDDFPSEDDINFSVRYDKIQNSSYANLHEDFSKDNDVEYHISLSNTDTNRTSDRYKVAQLSADDNDLWKFTLEKPFTNEINSFTNDETGNNVSRILDNTYLNIYKTAVDKSASHKFDGRFFVKIYNDDIFRRTLKDKHDEEINKEYKTVGVGRRIYSLKTHSGNRLDKHYVTNTDQTFKGIENDTTHPPVGLVDEASNDHDDSNHNWKKYSTVTDRFGKYLGTLNGIKENEDGDRTTLNTRDTRVWRDYDAYFRGINVSLADDAPRKYRVDKLDIEDDADNLKFEDVWFIDEAKNAAQFFHSTTEPGENTGWDTTPYTWFTNSVGITVDDIGQGELELAFGGIQPPAWSTNKDGFDVDDAFYDLADQNVHYSEQEADFIKNIAIGGQFRFKEDPDHTIYTVVDYEIFLRVRYESLLNYSNHTTDFRKNANNPPGGKNQLRSQHLFPFHAKARAGKASGWDSSSGNISTAHNIIPNADVDETGEGLTTILSTDDGIIFKTNSYLRPSNYTKNWRLVLDKNFSDKWNPLSNANQRIPGGKRIRTTSSRTTTLQSTEKNTVELSALHHNTALPQDGVLEVGMVLDKIHNHTVANSNLELAVVSKIEKISENPSKWIVSFKTYDGSTNLASGSNGCIDKIEEGQELRFRQYPMNNLSPNSAKNLNFFRNGQGFDDTYTGTNAVGYTLEWVEEKEARSQEEILPKNPAVWETKPKESPDLDIYYEASGQIPIRVELTSANFLDFIPLGSIVEHEGSNVIPPGTTIESIDVAEQEITLSSVIEVKYDPAAVGFLPNPSLTFHTP